MESDVSMYFLGAMRVLEVGAEVTCAMPHPRFRYRSRAAREVLDARKGDSTRMLTRSEAQLCHKRAAGITVTPPTLPRF